MAFVSFKKDCRFSKILSLSLIALTVTACSQTNPAEIRDLSGSSSTRIYSESSYEAPPANIVKAQSSVSSKEYNDRINSTTKENITYNRNYEAIPKGGYTGNTYTVKKGDTLFYIAWITGNDVRSLATKNHISEPYDLSIGQILDVNGNTNKSLVKNKVTTKQIVENRNKTTTTISKTEIIPANSSNSIAKINWQWPVKGKIIQSFSNESKGIDIQGSLGQRVNASADGTVVYAGNALAGYGNLIIIKHNDDYLTAYAHNQSILVKEQQEVKSGQQIATMGNTGTNSVRLHFEIRYKVKSVDPIKYLPK